MSTHNIGFYEDLTKLSLNYHQISSNTPLISTTEILPIISLFHLFTSPVGAIFDVLALQHFRECAFTFLAKNTIF